MGAITLAIRSEREQDIVTLRGVESNVDGPLATLASLPAGFGDCYLLSASVDCASIATLMASPEQNGPMTYLGISNAVQDVLDASRWTRKDAALQVSFELEEPRLWREGEVFGVEAAEVDTNVAPTVDVIVLCRVRRRRNIGSAVRRGRAPLAL